MALREDGVARTAGAETPSKAAPPEPMGSRLASIFNPKRRILFVVGTLDLGGSESQLVLLAEGLAKRGWTVEVFSLSRGGVLAERLNRAGIEVFYGHHRAAPERKLRAMAATTSVEPAVRATRRSSVKAMIVLARAEAWLSAHILATRPSAVHAVLPLTNFLGAVAGRLGFARLVITSRRGLGTHQERAPRMKAMDRIANRLSHIVLANSEAVARDTAKRDGYEIGRIRVIPNGLDLDRFERLERRRDESRRSLGLTAGEVAIVIVANLIPYKGHRDLLEAFAAAAARRPQIRLFLAGQDRGVGPILLEDAERLAIASKVVHMGTQRDVPGLLAGMDVGVIASHEEGFCNALLEKLAAGLPVVATDVGGNREALKELPGCELVRSHDPADLARGLLSILARVPEPAADCEFRRRAMRQRYSLEAMVDAYEKLYVAGRKALR